MKLSEYALNTGYRIKALYEGSKTHMVDFGNREPTHLIREDENGYFIKCKNGNMRFDARMNELLKAAGVKGILEIDI